MAAERRQMLTETVSAQDAEKFQQIMADHRNKSHPFNMEEVLAELPRSQLEELWENLLAWVALTLDTLLPEDGEVQSESVTLLTGVLDTALCTVAGLDPSGENVVPVPPGLLQVAAILNAMLLSLDELPALDAVCARVSRLCELWWRRRLPEAASLAPATLTYLLQLMVAAEHKTTRSLVQRVLALRPCLRGLSLSSPSCGRLRQLLSAAAQCTAALAWEEGVRLVGELLAEPALRPQLHDAIKAVLPTVTVKQAQRYGQAYYRAWQNTDAATRLGLEEQCIQDLMFHAVHADRQRSRLSRLLFQLLHHLHTQRLHQETARMLVRLYQPILWRALSAANEMVQLNATFIFLDVFPLEDPTEDRESRDAELGRQCRRMSELLAETSHQVRAAAAKGVCKVLMTHWELVPTESLKQLMKQLLQELAFDAAAAEVRQHAVTGMITVLDNPLSHVYMKSALPYLAEAFHDTQLSVRTAMCDLLLKVKHIKNIRYFDIVPVKHLLARLAVDEVPVCRRIVQLMSNSFFPATESDETLLGRCICLIQENREASRRFYHHSANVIPLDQVVRLMVAIRQALTVHARRQQQRAAAAATSRRPSSGDKENKGSRPGKRRLHNVEDRSVLSDASQESGSSDDSSRTSDAEAGPTVAPPASPLEKPEVLAGLVDVVAVLWTVRMPELVQEVASLEKLIAAWSRVLPLLFSCNKDTPAGDSLLYVASLLPHAVMAPLASHCLSVLRQLPDDAPRHRCAALLEPLINWGRCDDVIELCSECLQSAIDGEKSFVASQKNQRRSVAGVRFRDPRRVGPQPRLALRLLLHLFTPSVRRDSLATKYGGPLSELRGWISSCVMSVSEERLSSERPDANRDALVVELLTVYGVMSLALAAAGGHANAVTGLQDLLTWAHGVESAPARWANSALLSQVGATVTEMALQTSQTGVLQPELAAAAADWMQLQLRRPDAVVEGCVSALFYASDLLEAVTSRPEEQLSVWEPACSETVPQLVGAAVGQLTNLSSSGAEPTPGQLTELSSLLRTLVAGWRRLEAGGERPLRDLAALLLAAAGAHVAREKLTGSTEDPQPDLPPLTAALLSPLWRDRLACRLLVDRMEAALAPSAEADKSTAADGSVRAPSAEETSSAADTSAAEAADSEQTLCQVVTSSYVLHALTTSQEAALSLCRPAVSAALAAAGRVKPELLTGDDAPLQHFSAARRLLQELEVRLPAV